MAALGTTRPRACCATRQWKHGRLPDVRRVGARPGESDVVAVSASRGKIRRYAPVAPVVDIEGDIEALPCGLARASGLVKASFSRRQTSFAKLMLKRSPCSSDWQSWFRTSDAPAQPRQLRIFSDNVCLQELRMIALTSFCGANRTFGVFLADCSGPKTTVGSCRPERVRGRAGTVHHRLRPEPKRNGQVNEAGSTPTLGYDTSGPLLEHLSIICRHAFSFSQVRRSSWSRLN